VRWLALSVCAALVCVVCLAASARPAQAGINVWTSRGPPGGDVRALAVYPIMPIMPSMLYAAMFAGAFSGAGAPTREGGSHDTFE